MKKRAQAWGFDLLIASIIFTAGIVTFFLFSLNTPETQTTLDKLNYEGNVVASALLSEGSPINWTDTYVLTPGILSDNKINNTKLEILSDLITTNYQNVKNLFNTPNDFYIFLTNKNFTIQGSPVEGIGSQPTNPTDLIKISRAAIYNNKPVIINIVIWD